MKKLVVVTTFSAVALAAHSAAACDWNRQASAKPPVIAATTPAATNIEQTSRGAVPPSTSVASDESTRKFVDHQAPILLIDERH